MIFLQMIHLCTFLRQRVLTQSHLEHTQLPPPPPNDIINNTSLPVLVIINTQSSYVISSHLYAQLVKGHGPKRSVIFDLNTTFRYNKPLVSLQLHLSHLLSNVHALCFLYTPSSQGLLVYVQDSYETDHALIEHDSLLHESVQQNSFLE